MYILIVLSFLVLILFYILPYILNNKTQKYGFLGIGGTRGFIIK